MTNLISAPAPGAVWISKRPGLQALRWRVFYEEMKAEPSEAALASRRDVDAFDAVADHWDELQLRSTIVEHGEEIVYQVGSVAAMLPPAALLALWNEAADLAEGHLMFCGTLAAKGGIRPSPRFNFELHDPVLRRTIRGGYGITELPVVG